MNIQFRHLRATTLAATLVATLAAGAAFMGLATANTSDGTVRLLSAKFEPRHVVQVEVGDFHFRPGQVAPIHTHEAPVVGYVAKGSIIYRVEGQRPQILRAGDAFYEPAGPRILRFDNASATEEAIFIDFNLERDGDPFIVFENSPTEAIDQVEAYARELAAGATLSLNNQEPTMALVSEGVVELRTQGGLTRRVAAGVSFALPLDGAEITIVNASSEVPAKVITFLLK
jgi:quercetin dioxygenase-like cupin family protein